MAAPAALRPSASSAGPMEVDDEEWVAVPTSAATPPPPPPGATVPDHVPSGGAPTEDPAAKANLTSGY
eukprot:2683240-Prorocentrum_lima.AAC.1